MTTQSKEQTALLRSEMEFALNLLRQQDISKSFVFSPASISFCLALVHAAATGETRSEIRDVLLRGSTDGQLEKHLSSLLSEVSSTQYDTEVNIANHVFCLKDYPIKESYLNSLKKLYNSGATSLDFENEKEKSAKVISKFVEENTKGHMKNVMQVEDIEQDLVAVFVNAIYFKATWRNKFQADLTTKANFYSSETNSRSIGFLRSFSRESYSENDHFTMLCLPYEDTSFAMNIFLPKTRFGLKESLFKLTSASIHNLLLNTTDEYVDIKIPKWKIESTVNLNKVLKSLGIEKAFDIYKLEFDNMVYGMHGVSNVAHSAMIEVDEEGTTASACTVLRLRGGASIDKVVDFTADHPFLFILTKDLHPVFMGIHQ